MTPLRPRARVAAFLRYAVVGTLAFAIDLALTLMLARHVHYLIANALAFFVANVVQFAIVHVWVFGRGLSWREFLRLYPATLSISLLGLALSSALVFVGVGMIGAALAPTKAVTAVIVLFFNYALRARLLYRADSA